MVPGIVKRFEAGMIVDFNLLLVDVTFGKSSTEFGINWRSKESASSSEFLDTE